MASDLDLHGVYVPLVTPFTESGDVSVDEIKRLAIKVLDAGVTGIVALGTTGEPATLETHEREQVISAIGEVCSDRNAHFCVGTGTNNTKESIAMQDQAAAAGAQSVLSVVPYYTRPSESAIVEHFKLLAAKSRVPLIIYNIPYRTGRGLGASALLELARTPNIAGLKQAVGGVDADTVALLAEKPDDFHVLCGDDPYIFPMMTLGGAGAIAASSHVLTTAFVNMADATLRGDYKVGRELHQALLPVCTSLFVEPSPAVIKGVLRSLGVITNDALRMPMTSASAKAVKAATQIINTAKAQ